MTIQRSGWLTAGYKLSSPETVQILGFMHYNTGSDKVERATETLWRSVYLDPRELATKDFRPYLTTWEDAECWIGPNDFAVSTWRVSDLAFSEDGTECMFNQKRPGKEKLHKRLKIVSRVHDVLS